MTHGPWLIYPVDLTDLFVSQLIGDSSLDHKDNRLQARPPRDVSLVYPGLALA
jgi:hypothetical protein